MARLYLVRHGKAEADWATKYNPGLDDLGREQAKVTARSLAPLGPLKIISSPYARALETAAPLAKIWDAAIQVDERLGEIPSPVKDLAERGEWLQKVIGAKWLNLDRNLNAWRRHVIEALCEPEENAVVFSHLIAINVAVGQATANDHTLCFWAENGSVTTIDVNGPVLNLIELGVADATKNWKNINI
ncbi:histidine phosphatase family protein [Thermodesulfobacteriota bacterium]